MQNSNIQDWKNQKAVLEIYDKSVYEIEQLEEAIENGDIDEDANANFQKFEKE